MHLRFADGDGDVAGIREIYAPVIEQTAISFETVVPTHEEIEHRLADTMPQYPWLVATGDREDGHVLGYAYGHRFAERAAYGWSVETSIYVRDTARGQGVGRALYDALLTLLAAQGYQQAFAGIALPNEASVRLHEAAGFRRVATFERVGFKFERWHDVGWWQRPLAEGSLNPDAPVPVHALDPGLLEGVLR